MSSAKDAYEELAAAHGLQAAARQPGPLTPLLVEGMGAGLKPAVEGTLPGGETGIAGQLSYKRNKTFRFHVVLTAVPEAQAFAPRVFCIRNGRSTRDDVFYGFEARDSKLWTESAALSERFTVSTSPFQDPNWMRQLFSPVLIDWLAAETPADFSFELAYGDLLCSIEEDDPDRAQLEALCTAASHLTGRVREECRE